MTLSIVLTPIAQYLQVRAASLPYFSCSLLWPVRRYFLNKNLLATVCRVDEEHLVTYDLSMQAFPCGINVPHDEYAQPMILIIKTCVEWSKSDGCVPSMLDLVY